MPRSLSLAVVALAAASAAFAQQTSDPVLFSGTVTNTATGAPVANARAVLQPKGGETLTDASGTFQFTQLEPGDYLVMADKRGFIAADDHEGGDGVELNVSREEAPTPPASGSKSDRRT